MSEAGKVAFVKRCPACGKWMVWSTANPDIRDEWWCRCGHHEPGVIDKSRLVMDMAIHIWYSVNMEENNGKPVHSLYPVEVVTDE